MRGRLTGQPRYLLCTLLYLLCTDCFVFTMYCIVLYAGMATMSVMSIISDSMKAKVYDARSAYMSCMRDKGLITAIVGGGLLGAGMTVAGTVSISLI